MKTPEPENADTTNDHSHSERAALVPEWTNPLVEQRADPWVARHDDGYHYFIATVPEYDRLEIRRARTLDGLRNAPARVIWRKHESGIMGSHIWAPELHRIDGRWYIYFAAGGAGDDVADVWDIRMYVLENESSNPMEGAWVEKGQIETDWVSFSLDATTFEHRGKRYLVWAQHDPRIGGNTSLFIAEMDTPWSIKRPQVALSNPELPWEVIGFRVNEGAAVMKRNGRIFIGYSASATDFNYCMGLLFADEDADLLDPKSWTKSPEPVFRTDEGAGQFGPGHNCFIENDDGEVIMVYHARNYKEIDGDPLDDPNRHTRAQLIRWRDDGMPDFGTPVSDSPAASKPLFRDPVYDGAADPVVVRNRAAKSWWLFYTNRRANLPAEEVSGVSWVHGTRLGIAESTDGGVTWNYRGTAAIELPEELGGAEATHWAPDIVFHEGTYHMFLSVVPGVFSDWQHPRRIVRLTSPDLENWTFQGEIPLSSDRVIDAGLLRLGDGTWRMWYNDENDGKSIRYADSADLITWNDRGLAVNDQAGEGPKVFYWQGCYWLVVDVWHGLAAYRSDDAKTWKRQPDNLLDRPGAGDDDAAFGRHADVVVSGERAFVFYFTHPHDGEARPGPEDRRSSIQVAELSVRDGRLACDRDAPVRLERSTLSAE